MDFVPIEIQLKTVSIPLANFDCEKNYSCSRYTEDAREASGVCYSVDFGSLMQQGQGSLKRNKSEYY